LDAAATSQDESALLSLIAAAGHAAGAVAGRERVISNSGMGWPFSRHPETVSEMILTEAEAI
jgi:hypothetical protein